MESNNDDVPETTIFSLGYRCSSAGILKSMGLKHESFPFDWLISRLPVVQHCITNDFKEFLQVSNYVPKITNTYSSMHSTTGFVCDEHILYNTFYQPEQFRDCSNTYMYQLALNHRDIRKPEDIDYFNRCIVRLDRLLDSSEMKTYLHITPVVSTYFYEKHKENIVNEIKRFDSFIWERGNHNIRGLIFVMVINRSMEGKPEQELIEQLDNETRIYKIVTNRDFVDAGEIFMGNHGSELNFIKNMIYTYL